jgi:hypothetical protein
VRQFAIVAGISESAAAEARQQFIEEGVLAPTDIGYRMREQPSLLHEQLLKGYEQIMRPCLFINRYRIPSSPSGEAIEYIQKLLEGTPTRWSLSGGPASYGLNHFYKGLDIPLFFEHFTSEAARKIKLLPDRDGLVVVLKSFGDLPFWKTVEGISIAHPWLIYCELMYSRDPRAHEAAGEFRSEYLPNG